MGVIKNVDDISLKHSEDVHTIKGLDDVTIKAFDDLHTLKGVDDFHTSKAVDDLHTIYETLSHETIYETLQEGPGGTIVETLVEGQTFGGEGIFNSPGGGFTDPSGMSAQPFVLANPHHTMAWTQTFGDPNDPKVRSQVYENHLSQIEAAKSQLSEQLKQLEQYHEKIKKEFDDMKQSETKEEK